MEHKTRATLCAHMPLHSEAFQHLLQEISKQNTNNKCISFSLNGIGTTNEKNCQSFKQIQKILLMQKC